MGYKIKKWYLALLEKEKKNLFEGTFYCFLCFLSFIYAGLVSLRNALYSLKVIPSYKVDAKIVSVGNISWSGSGKTPLSIWLYDKFSSKFKVAVLRRGYGEDEGSLLKERLGDVFSSPDRYKLAKKLQSSFGMFVLDDGFQYRKLKKDVNIVIMGAREFKKKHRLIPAYFFREPISALKRADIVVLNHSREMKEPLEIKDFIMRLAPDVKVYLSNYKFKKFLDLNEEEIDRDFFNGKRIAALAGIGYPQGFFRKLKEIGLDIVREIIYPDHYELGESEFVLLEDDLIKEGIDALIITRKDKYHLPCKEARIRIYIMEIDISIDNEKDFIKEINTKLTGTIKDNVFFS